MIISEKKKLHLLGRTPSPMIKKVSPHTSQKKNCEWFFVDYASDNFKLDETFDIFLSDGNLGNNWNHEYKIKLIRIIDEFGREQDSIPRGYKTVCRFEFSPHVPSIIKKIPLRFGWEDSENGIYLMQRSSIDLLSFDKTSNGLHKLIVSMVLEKIRSHTTKEFSEEQFATFISSNLSDDISLRKNLIYQLISDGRLEKKENNKLILTT
jgi:hypothetical protein